MLYTSTSNGDKENKIRFEGGAQITFDPINALRFWREAKCGRSDTANYICGFKKSSSVDQRKYFQLTLIKLD